MKFSQLINCILLQINPDITGKAEIIALAKRRAMFNFCREN